MANARIILQGRHSDELQSKWVDKASPTCCTQMKWELKSADDESTFPQAADLRKQGIRVYGKPTRDTCRWQEKLCGTGEVRMVRFTKPAFGDPRAPRLWYNSVSSAMEQGEFTTHALDKWMFMSYREAAGHEIDAVHTDAGGRVER